MNKILLRTILFFHLFLGGISISYNPIKYVLILIFFLSLLSDFNILFEKKNRRLNILLLSFIASVLISSYLCSLDVDLKRKVSLISPNIGVTFSTIFFLSYWFVETLNNYKKKYLFCNYLFVLTTLYIVIVDSFVFKTILTQAINAGTIYLIGSKFSVVYLHYIWMFLYAFKSDYFLKGKYVVLKLRLMLLQTLIISVLVQCSTGILGIILIFVVFSYRKHLKKIILSPIPLIVSIIFCSLFVFILEFFLKIPMVQYLIVDILHEDLTLTGRTYIYEFLMDIISINFFWGYGYGNSSFMVTYMLGFGNPQNAVLDFIVNVGFIGFVFFILVLYFLYKNSSKNIYSYYFLSLLIIYIILGTVEITFRAQFMAIMSLLLLTPNKTRSLKCS